MKASELDSMSPYEGCSLGKSAKDFALGVVKRMEQGFIAVGSPAVRFNKKTCGWEMAQNFIKAKGLESGTFKPSNSGELENE